MSKEKNTVDKNWKSALLPVGIVVAFALLAVLVMVIGHKVRNDDEAALEAAGWHDYKEYFGKGLDKNGMLKDVDVADYVTLCDYKSISVPEGTEAEQKEYLLNYLVENSTVKDCPEYLAALEGRITFMLTQRYKDNEAHFYEAYGKYQFEDVYDAYDKTKEEFEAYVTEVARKEMVKYMILQCICEKEGYKVKDDDVESWVLAAGYEEEDLDGIVYQHGEAYLKRMTMEMVVVEKLLK